MKLIPAMTLLEASNFLDASYKGNPEALITGINEIHMVEQGDITFVDHPKYYKKALESKATFIIINNDREAPEGKGLIISEDPFADYVKIVTKYRSFERCERLVSPSAHIGEGTVIQPGAFIGNHVKIGENCIIHANASIYDHCVLGNDVIIHSGAVIGADAYYFQRKPAGYRKMESCGRVVLGDRVEIGALTSIDKGVSGDTTVGDGTKFDNHTQIGHDTHIGKNCLIGAHCAIAGVTSIEDDVIIWARVSIDKDLTIGKGAVILATSGVDKTLEGNKTYFGSPVDDVRKKWREMAILRKLPEIYAKVNKL